MFTGIVETTGAVAALTQAGAGQWRLAVDSGTVARDAVLGESVAVNGCCLTVARIEGPRLGFDLLEETRRLTNLGTIPVGGPVNLERSLRADSRLGGHFLTGHIDGLGKVLRFERRGNDHYLRVRCPEGMGRYVVPKGCVAVDGVSLTVFEAEGDEFSVWLIPHTLEVTALRERRPSDGVNLEFDLLAKYVEKLTAARSA